MFTTLTATVALLAAQVAAHGAVTKYVIDGVDYPGYNGYSPSSSTKTIQRQWKTYDPIMSASSSLMRCNGGTSASISAAVKPGSKIEAIWGQWTHAQGPIMVWLYKCAGEFSSCDGSGAGWFKIDEAGYTPASGVYLDSEKNSGWAIAKLVGGNKGYTTTLPAVVPGNYLIRHELIALHQARAPQFYPECAQIVIGGSGTLSPSASYLVSIPGYVSQSDKSVTFNINDHSTEQKYTCPGPAVFPGSSSKARREFVA